MPDLWMPGADTSRRYDRAYPGTTQATVSKVLLHSTETDVLPGYGGGATAPTMTVDPWRRRVWQHFPATMAARALLNPDWTPVSENRDNVAQIEIIGYSDAAKARQYAPGFDLRDLPESGYDYLAEVIAWYVTEWGVPLRFPAEWPEYPASFGRTTRARMTSSQYDAYMGILGHLHASGNDHGDPTIDPARLEAAVRRHLLPQPDPEVTALQEALVEAGLLSPTDVDGIDGPRTQAAQEAYEMTLNDLETKLDALGVKLDAHATILERIEAAVRGIPRAVAGFVSNGRDLVTWMRLGAGALRLTPEGTEVGILPPVPPLEDGDVLSKPAKP